MSITGPTDDPPVVNMHDAKTHLSRLVDKASHGMPFVIARSGRPLVRVVSVNGPSDAGVHTHSRRGFLKTKLHFPEDPDEFNGMAAVAIAELFAATAK